MNQSPEVRILYTLTGGAHQAQPTDMLNNLLTRFRNVLRPFLPRSFHLGPEIVTLVDTGDAALCVIDGQE